MRPSSLRLHYDTGLQPERTALAWTRTTISLTLVSMIWLRWAHAFGETVLTMVAFLGAAAVALHLTQRRRYRKAATGLATDRLRADVRGVFLLTACMLIFGIGGLFLILS